jgi:hypothetical protein
MRSESARMTECITEGSVMTHDQGFMEFFSQNYYIVQLQCTHVASHDPTEDSTIVGSTLAALAQIKLLGYAEILNFHFEEQFFCERK